MDRGEQLGLQWHDSQEIQDKPVFFIVPRAFGIRHVILNLPAQPPFF
jgi:hypothetical protein